MKTLKAKQNKPLSESLWTMASIIVLTKCIGQYEANQINIESIQRNVIDGCIFEKLEPNLHPLLKPGFINTDELIGHVLPLILKSTIIFIDHLSIEDLTSRSQISLPDIFNRHQVISELKESGYQNEELKDTYHLLKLIAKCTENIIHDGDVRISIGNVYDILGSTISQKDRIDSIQGVLKKTKSLSLANLLNSTQDQ